MIQLSLLSLNIAITYLALLIAFYVRYLFPAPADRFEPNFTILISLTLIISISLAVFRVYKSRFKSSWELFRGVFLGLTLGILLCVAFVYVFRDKWGTFPTSVFLIAYLINVLLIFKVNQLILKAIKKIKKLVVIVGEGKVDDIVSSQAKVERVGIDQIHELLKKVDSIDEIVICERISDAKDLNLLLYLERKSKAQILFSPSVYVELLPEIINGNSSDELLSTFVGRQSDIDELLITVLDISASLVLLILAAVPMLIFSILIKLSSRGSIIYKQERVGKNGKPFTLYKFRSMVKDAEKLSGFAPAMNDDPRVTKVGKLLRRYRLDELPQLLNILQGKMSLVGPRPENLHRVNTHRALQGIRLAVKPGLTGLAQVKSNYDLQPKHKIKYDYVYIQRRSFWLNMYILLQTVPVVLSKTGW